MQQLQQQLLLYIQLDGEGSLSSNVLYSNKGEESYIKSGMTCEARIITRKEKMLYYLLEKIGFKN